MSPEQTFPTYREVSQDHSEMLLGMPQIWLKLILFFF